MFDDETSSISRLYRKLECEHHLVQADSVERPDIPALTPAGFERWMTFEILTDPDGAYQRLSQSIKDLPIFNPDNARIDLSKIIQRENFPTEPDTKIHLILESAIREHTGR